MARVNSCAARRRSSVPATGARQRKSPRGPAGGDGRIPRRQIRGANLMIRIAYWSPSVESAADEYAIGAEAHPGLGHPLRSPFDVCAAHRPDRRRR